MNIEFFVVAVIIVAGVVTWLSRVLPFVLTQNHGLPKQIIKLLKYMPIAIIFALVLSNITSINNGCLPTVEWRETIAVVPTLWSALRFSNIVIPIIVGIVSVAVLRLI